MVFHRLFSLPPAGHPIPLLAIALSVSGWLKGNGDSSFSESILGYVGAREGLFLSSGRAALWLALQAAADLKPERKEVILPAYTCPAVASAVLKAGLQPVLCDINLFDYGFSRERLSEKINPKTLAVIVVHLFGYPAEMGRVGDLCRDAGAVLIEDAAQAFGNSFPDFPALKTGLRGDAGVYSFGRGKPINALHGGLLVCRSEAIQDQALRIFRGLKKGRENDLSYAAKLGMYLIFSNPRLYWVPQRIPFLHLGETIFEPEFSPGRGNPLARNLIKNLIPTFEKEIKSREKNSQWFSRNFMGPSLTANTRSETLALLRYPVLLENPQARDAILKRLQEEGTGVSSFYPAPLNELPGLKDILRDGGPYPNAEKLARGLITLPVHSGLTPSLGEKIIAAIGKRAGSSCGIPFSG
jgi:perosamine synthetase